MKITENPYYSATFPASKTLRPTSASDLKPTLKKTRNPRPTRVEVEVEDEEVNEGGRRSRWKHQKAAGVVSARKLAAGLWRLQGSENSSGGHGECLDRLGFQVFVCLCTKFYTYQFDHDFVIAVFFSLVYTTSGVTMMSSFTMTRNAA
ncbi:hypothetical protein Patl1_04201 [Pistacia atlantica]|uniref:Uncharacterized protein n=1 Tax=Pistacia atlantica TaxID=434234 RepID=A0ACC1BTY7_9ROSI|nr:hypothetical protein Patl1_04201 [Pistacia atlantica]